MLTYETWRQVRSPAGTCHRLGTILDTARFRAALSDHFGVDPRSVHAFIVGEHGDSEVPVWSSANIAGMRLPEFCSANRIRYDRDAMEAIFVSVRDAAYEIIQRKGATYYAVAAGLLRIVEAIVRDQRTVLSVSSLIRDYNGIDDVYLSLPTVIHREGVDRVLRIDLSVAEFDGLRVGAVLRETIASPRRGASAGVLRRRGPTVRPGLMCVPSRPLRVGQGYSVTSRCRSCWRRHARLRRRGVGRVVRQVDADHPHPACPAR